MNERLVLLTGDLIIDEDEPERRFDLARETLLGADLVVGHVEVPFTLRRDGGGANPNPGRDPSKLAALAGAGVRVATLAANHLYDQGRVGVLDTLDGLAAAGIAAAGAGADLEAARRPALSDLGGLRLGVLSFNCVGPRETWAGPAKAGCAYVEVVTQYELDHATPGAPPTRVLTFAVPDTLEAMEADIARARAGVDLLVVALHKGLIHTPARLAMYERPVARAAIEAGADVVVSHHAHILRGVEIHRGRPIYHGLGNFVTVTQVLNVEANPNPEMVAWARRRREMFGFDPDPATPSYPFHPESRNAMLAAVRFDARGLVAAGFVPCWIEADGSPRPLRSEAEAEPVVAYIRRITDAAGLPALDLTWKQGMVEFWRRP